MDAKKVAAIVALGVGGFMVGRLVANRTARLARDRTLRANAELKSLEAELKSLRSKPVSVSPSDATVTELPLTPEQQRELIQSIQSKKKDGLAQCDLVSSGRKTRFDLIVENA